MKRLLLLVTLLSACGGTTTAPDGGAVAAVAAGTYTLRTYNGGALPAFTPVSVSFITIELLDDTIQLMANGTFTQSGHTRLTESGKASVQTFSDAGTYTSANGNS